MEIDIIFNKFILQSNTVNSSDKHYLMKEVILKPLQHRGMECIGIYFEIDYKIQGVLQKTKVVKFSSTHKCWYASLSKENYDRIFLALKGFGIIEQSALHKYLEDKKRINSADTISRNRVIAKKGNKETPRPVISNQLNPTWVSNNVLIYKKEKICPANAHIIPAMHQHLKLKAYSPSTIKTYLNEMSQLLNILRNIPADDLTPALLKRYMVFCLEKLQLKENTLHSRINAMKFYYEQVLGRDKFFWEIPRPKKHLILSKLLNENELAKLFNSLINKKHKAMLFTIYSAGLRVSELVNLKIRYIDSQRMQIFIEKAKKRE